MVKIPGYIGIDGWKENNLFSAMSEKQNVPFWQDLRDIIMLKIIAIKNFNGSVNIEMFR